jgi:hypothetical protein
VSILAFCDLILSVFPVAWIFGRGGCSVVHDHKGALVDSILSVEFPRFGPGRHAPIQLIHGPELRFDLGLLEWMFTVVLALAFALTWKKRLPVGTYVVATALSYAPVRFVLDYFRLHEGAESDPRYGGFTPGQWACVGLFVFGLVMWKKMRDIQASGEDLYAPFMARGAEADAEAPRAAENAAHGPAPRDLRFDGLERASRPSAVCEVRLEPRAYVGREGDLRRPREVAADAGVVQGGCAHAVLPDEDVAERARGRAELGHVDANGDRVAEAEGGFVGRVHVHGREADASAVDEAVVAALERPEERFHGLVPVPEVPREEDDPRGVDLFEPHRPLDLERRHGRGQ